MMYDVVNNRFYNIFDNVHIIDVKRIRNKLTTYVGSVINGMTWVRLGDGENTHAQNY